MKVPVLVVGPRAIARPVAAALQSECNVTIEEDSARARALAAIGAHLVVIAVGGASVPGALEVAPSTDPAALTAEVAVVLSRAWSALQDNARDDDVGVLKYDDYLELTRYAGTRRYLASLLVRHGGSVTDAARGAGLKRESLHRLLRRHHIGAEDFRGR